MTRTTIGFWAYYSLACCAFTVEGFLAERPTELLPVVLRQKCHCPSRLWGSLENNNDSHEDDEIVDDDDDDDDEVTQTAYGSRSLAWTNRYRRLVPYEYTRFNAMSLGLKSKEEWLEQGALGRQGPYIISRPDEMYQEEWISWEEFLGVMRPYAETKQMVQSILQLKSMDEYREFVKNDPKRAEGLRIPAKPDIVYRDSGWQGSDVFFGTSSTSTQ